VTNEHADHRRRRSVWLGVLLGLLLALGGVGYALSTSPSAPTGQGKVKPSATPTADVLAPGSPSNPTSTPTPTGSGGSAGTQVVLAPAASNGNGNGNCVEPSNGNGSCVKSFGVAVGSAPTLYPGLLRSLPVSYSNPNNFDIFVTSYRVSVSVPSSQTSTCPASNLQVPAGTVTLSPRLTAPKKGSVATTIPIRLSANAPDGCQSASFSITVNASAVKQ